MRRKLPTGSDEPVGVVYALYLVWKYPQLCGNLLNNFYKQISRDFAARRKNVLTVFEAFHKS
jgi:hypothetical protein